MDYLWLKALHVFAVAMWTGGMLASALAIATTFQGAISAPGAPICLAVMRQWDRWATTPAMLLVWALGITLAVEGGWFSTHWLMAKLALVLALSAMHGWLSGTLRRLGSSSATPAPQILRAAPFALALAVLAIVILVVVKPI